jgi:hypothetical protein
VVGRFTTRESPLWTVEIGFGAIFSRFLAREQYLRFGVFPAIGACGVKISSLLLYFHYTY